MDGGMRRQDRNRESRERSRSVDLPVVALAAFLASAAALAPGTRGTLLAFILGLPLVLFLPGYAILAALFPRRGTAADQSNQTPPLGPALRFGLALPVSLALVPLVIGPLAWTRWGIDTTPVVVVLAGITMLGTAVAHLRRQGDANPRRHRKQRIPRLRGAERSETVVAVFLIGSIVLAATTLVIAIGMPPTGDGTAGIYLGTTTEDGDVVAGDYPREFTAGDAESLVIGVENDRPTSASYWVVVAVEVLDEDGQAVIERDELDRFATGDLEPGERWHHEHDVAPDRTGENLRLVYLLFEDEPPEDPDTEEADDWVWLTVAVEG